MTKTKVAILGHEGMLSSMVLDVLSRDKDLNVQVLARPYLEASTSSAEDIQKMIKGCEWVINGIGKIKSFIKEDSPASVETAILVNALFPHRLQEAAQKVNAKVIQIATDCVYSGEYGKYAESDPHDAHDVYGKTKSLGEAKADNFYNLRCSIIGPEVKSYISLMDWFLSQQGEVNGFTNHLWSGISTYHFAKICQGIIKNNLILPNVQHIIPSNNITKHDLLKTLAEEFHKDILINPVEAPMAIDRTLSTNYQGFNMDIWHTAGYKIPPTIEQMVKELKDIK